MIPDSINTNNSLTIKEPIKIELSIDKETMVFLGIVTTFLMVGYKLIKK